jgi:hypothetical protein
VKLAELATQLNVDDWKYIAFHLGRNAWETDLHRLGQTYALTQGKECFTKSNLSEYLPTLRPFLYREYDTFTPEIVNPLDDIKAKLMESIESAKYSKKGTLSLVYVGMTLSQSS